MTETSRAKLVTSLMLLWLFAGAVITVASGDFPKGF